MKILIASLLMAALSLQAYSAEVYRWVDKNGKVHYSDKPPAKSLKATKINIADDSLEEDRIRDNNESGKPQISAQQRVRKAQQLLTQSRHKKAAEQQQKLKQEQKLKQDNQQCAKAQKLLDGYRANTLRTENEKGEIEYLNLVERAAAIKSAEEKVRQLCQN